MPELPEVEHFRRFLARHGRGQRITRVDVLDASVLRNVSGQRLHRDIEGRRFLSPRRHGKWLLARTDGPTLLLHFGMTGELVWKTRPDERHPHDRIVFVLEHGELRYRDQRKLQGIWLARDEREANRIMGHQGPDALDVDDPGFHELLADHRGRIKAVLMDQEIIAGLGNIATDEILWRARIHPTCHANELNATEVRRVHRSMQHVLRDSIRQGRIPARRGWLAGVRDQDRPACPRCATVTRTRTGGRNSYSCPRCQPRTRAKAATRRAPRRPRVAVGSR